MGASGVLSSDPNLDPDLNPEAERVEVSLDDVPDPDAKPEPGIDSWSFADISTMSLDDVPEAIRPWVSKVTEVAKRQLTDTESRIEAEQRRLDEKVQAWDNLIKSLEGSDDKSAQLAQAVRAKEEVEGNLRKNLEEMIHENATVTWNLFERSHPEYESLPQSTRDLFVSYLSKPLDTLFSGKNDYERMEEALRFAVFKTGAQVQQPAASRREVDEDEDAGKAVLLSRSNTNPAIPRGDIRHLTADDILDRDDYLLRD